ncbi:MAG: ester cyclase [bacterium]
MMNKEAFMNTWFQRVWTDEDPSAVEEMFDPDGRVEGLGGNALIGVDQFKAFQGAILGLMTEMRFTIDKCVEEEEWTSIFCTINAKSRETGAPIKMTGSILVRIEGDKIVEGYNYFDFLGLWMQLGLLPADTFERGLTGQKTG